VISDTLLFAGAENIDNWHARKVDWQCAFVLDVPMVHLSMLAVTTDGKRLMCGGFSLKKTIRFGILEFIVDCFGSLSLSPKGSNSGAIFMGTTHHGSPSLHAMIEESSDEFYMASSGEESSSLPASWRQSMGAPPAATATTLCLEDAPTT
jgi:hypothetical protein